VILDNNVTGRLAQIDVRTVILEASVADAKHNALAVS
jgi:hypothetical protein